MKIFVRENREPRFKITKFHRYNNGYKFNQKFKVKVYLCETENNEFIYFLCWIIVSWIIFVRSC